MAKIESIRGKVQKIGEAQKLNVEQQELPQGIVETFAMSILLIVLLSIIQNCMKHFREFLDNKVIDDISIVQNIHVGSWIPNG